MLVRKVKGLLLMLLLGASVPVALRAQETAPERSPSGPASSLVDRAKNFLGTPYRYGGRTPKGFDCSGFVSFVFDSFGVTLPRSSVRQAKEGESIDLDEIQPGDLLFFKTRGKKNRISHVGIYLGESQFIHAGAWGSRKSRCVKVSDLDGSYYVQRLVSARRVLGPASAVLDVSQQVLNLGDSQKREACVEP